MASGRVEFAPSPIIAHQNVQYKDGTPHFACSPPTFPMYSRYSRPTVLPIVSAPEGLRGNGIRVDIPFPIKDMRDSCLILPVDFDRYYSQLFCTNSFPPKERIRRPQISLVVTTSRFMRYSPHFGCKSACRICILPKC